MGGTLSTNEGVRSVDKVLVGKPERNRPSVKPSHTWEDNGKINLKELGRKAVDWSFLDRSMDCCVTPVNTALDLFVL
jgi:hypothetical protein